MIRTPIKCRQSKENVTLRCQSQFRLEARQKVEEDGECGQDQNHEG